MLLDLKVAKSRQHLIAPYILGDKHIVYTLCSGRCAFGFKNIDE